MFKLELLKKSRWKFILNFPTQDIAQWSLISLQKIPVAEKTWGTFVRITSIKDDLLKYLSFKRVGELIYWSRQLQMCLSTSEDWKHQSKFKPPIKIKSKFVKLCNISVSIEIASYVAAGRR